MRNLKRALSLALASVMLLGMMVVGSSAKGIDDFTDKAEIVNADVRDRAAQITIRFVSQMISVTRDKAGAVVDGNAEKLTDVTDVWTFARDITSRDPNWKLVGTESGQ